MVEPIVESRVQVLQWGWLLYGLLVVPPAAAVSAGILVPGASRLYPANYQSEDAVALLTGIVFAGMLTLVWSLMGLRMLVFRRQRVLLYPDRLEFHTGALIGRRRLVLPLDRIKGVRTRRALFGFGRYGTVAVRSRPMRKTRMLGVLRFRDLDQALRQAIAKLPSPPAANPLT